METDPIMRREAEEKLSKVKSLKTTMYVLVGVAVALVAVLAYVWSQKSALISELEDEKQDLTVQMENLQNDYASLSSDYDSINSQLDTSRAEVANLIERIKKTDATNRAKMRQYEKELGTLRSIMRNYIVQIDSLNTLNKKLIDENVSYRKEITTAQMRAEMAEEKAQELNNKVRQGSVINARGIRMVALNARSKEVSRIKNAERLRVDFTLTANALATPGEKTIYVRILSPDGYVLSSESVPTFEFEGERLSYSASRDVDYQNEDLNIGIFYTGSGFTAGTYQVQIYCDGFLIGSIELPMR